MNKLDLAQLLANQSNNSPGKAADAVDALVHRMIKEIKTPKPALNPVSARVGPPSSGAAGKKRAVQKTRRREP